MSATAFQRLRREQERIRLDQQQQVQEEAKVEVTGYSKMKKDELKDILTFKGIEFDDRATKNELIALLEGVE